MPTEVIQHVTHISQQQAMPDTLTFANCHKKEIKDHLEEIDQDGGDDDDYYPPHDDHYETDDEFSFDEQTYDTPQDDYDPGNDDELAVMDEDVHDDEAKVDVTNNDSQEIIGDDNDLDVKGDNPKEGEDTHIIFDSLDTDDSVSLHPVETTGVELDARNAGVEQETPIKVDAPPYPHKEPTEAKLFEQADALGW